MAGLFTAQIEAAFAHLLDHIAVADLGALELEVDGFQVFFEAQIGHHRRDNAVAGQKAAPFPVACDQADELVAVNFLTALIDEDAAVRVAIECDADICAVFANGFAQRMGVCAADLLIDVEAIWRHADGEDLGAQLIKGRRGDLVGGAVCTIDTDAKVGEAHTTREGGLHDLNIAGLGVIDAARAAERGRRGELVVKRAVHPAFDFQLNLIGELVAVRAEEFEAIVLIGIVAG